MTENESMIAFLRPLASDIIFMRTSPKKEPKLKID